MPPNPSVAGCCRPGRPGRRSGRAAPPRSGTSPEGKPHRARGDLLPAARLRHDGPSDGAAGGAPSHARAPRDDPSGRPSASDCGHSVCRLVRRTWRRTGPARRHRGPRTRRERRRPSPRATGPAELTRAVGDVAASRRRYDPEAAVGDVVAADGLRDTPAVVRRPDRRRVGGHRDRRSVGDSPTVAGRSRRLRTASSVAVASWRRSRRASRGSRGRCGPQPEPLDGRAAARLDAPRHGGATSMHRGSATASRLPVDRARVRCTFDAGDARRRRRSSPCSAPAASGRELEAAVTVHRPRPVRPGRAAPAHADDRPVARLADGAPRDRSTSRPVWLAEAGEHDVRPSDRPDGDPDAPHLDARSTLGPRIPSTRPRRRSDIVRTTASSSAGSRERLWLGATWRPRARRGSPGHAGPRVTARQPWTISAISSRRNGGPLTSSVVTQLSRHASRSSRTFSLGPTR